MTEAEFKEQAVIFFAKESKYYSVDYPISIETSALAFVREGDTFKYKDHVEAGVLVRCLENLSYIKYLKKENNIRYHILTQKGLLFIETYKKTGKWL